MLNVAFILFLLVTVGVVVLAFVNFLNEVTFSLLIWQIPHISVGLLCLLAFLLGALMLYVISVAAAQREVRELKKLRDRVAELEQETTYQDVFNSSPAAISLVPMPGMPSRNISDIPTQH
ncbi:MAG: lipopolysaccharide assembly protein LapA domain-containing protein [Ktedonobacteraceae bacterium]